LNIYLESHEQRPARPIVI